MERFRFDTAFEEQAARTPQAVALRFHDDSITYAELDARANRVANTLRQAGVRSGSYVGLHLERSIDTVVAQLGILKADSAVVPLPPSWPAERVAEILGFARLDAVIDAATRFDTRDTTRPPRSGRGGSDAPAFVICSSGSTGTPKMIVRSHKSFLHRLRWTWEQYPYAADDVCVQKSFLATTHAVYELFEPLLRGVAVRLVPDESSRDLAAFWDLLAAERVTRLLIVPSMLQASLDLPGFRPPPLRVLILMGEHVPARLASRVTAAFPPGTRIYSIYGSSEASSTLVSDLRAPRDPDEDPPLGTPITTDVQVSVLDSVLHVAGSPLFTEYFRNAAGTAAAFATRSGAERLYRTGDLVRERADGALVFAGRADGVVKVRGFRVDLGDVERWLLRAPGVAQGVVVPHPDAASAATLIAFVTPAGVATAPVFAWLRAHLPSYMLPSKVVGMDAFPSTPSGKVDRMRLVREHRDDGAAAPVQYESETERGVAAVWSELLGVPAVAADRSFFEIGGTSLTVFAAAHRLRERFGLSTGQLGAATLYTYPTLTDLAGAIDRARRGEAATGDDESVLVPLRRGAGSGRAPLFVVSAAGGTLGAYDKTVRALRTTREVIGLRDPLLAGARDPREGFQPWVRRYTDAVRRAQPAGSYHILAYSSAGAFGYEIAQQLRADGHDVALLVLVDPVAMDYANPRRFGHWALQARFTRAAVRELIRWAGAARVALPHAVRRARTATSVNDWAPSDAEFADLVAWSNSTRDSILRFSTLLEISTGRPFAIQGPRLDLDALLARVAEVDPSIDAEMIRRAIVQYELQVRAQQRYELQRYDGAVHLFEVAGPYAGLIAAQLRPYVRTLHARTVEPGQQSERTRELLGVFPEGLRGHYGCMRNDAFAEQLAAELDVLLDAG